MKALILERPAIFSPLSLPAARDSAPRVLPAGGQRRALLGLLSRLEAWLPEEERRLASARDRGRRDRQREADWHQLLRLYERLSVALAPPSSARG